MESKEKLTNEKLRLRVKSQFELVNHAIKLAENMIRSGRDARVKMECQNRALQIIAEIDEGRDQFEVIAQPRTEPKDSDVQQHRSSSPERADRKKRALREYIPS